MAATFGVHELRYRLAFGAEAGETLQRHGHGYLAWVGPVIGALMAVALAQLLHRVATGGVVERPSALRIRRLWPVAAAGLIAMYAGQELLEGALSSGHPDGVAGVFGAGGWVALPLAVVLGGVVALAVGVARTLEERAVPGIAVPRALAAPTDWRTPARRCRPKGRLLATHLAGRSPPQFSVVP